MKNPAPQILGTDGKPIRWSRLPLTIHTWPDAPMKMHAAVAMACHHWNKTAIKRATRFFRPWDRLEHLDVAVYLDERECYATHSLMPGGHLVDTASVRLMHLDFWPMVTACKHELGHALGLAHDEQTPRALMYPKLGTRRQPTKREVLTVLGELG